MRMKKTPFRFVLPELFFLSSILGAGSALGQAGSLDSTFGTGGITVTSFASSGFVTPDSIQLQSDGKILVLVQAGNSTSEVLRFTTTGALDTSFGSQGIATLAQPLHVSMMLQPNGQIVIAGIVTNLSDIATALGVERLNPDGTQDTSFGSGGLATASLGGRVPGVGEVVLVQPDGGIFVCAQLEPTGRRRPYQTLLARFTSAGTLDSTFGTQGTTVATGPAGCSAVALLSSGDYLVVNSQQIGQFTATGSLEASTTGGVVVASTGSSASSTPSIIKANGGYLFGGELFMGAEVRAHNAAATVLAYTVAGSADPNFANPVFHYSGTGGAGIEAFVHALAVQSDGSIVVVGNQLTYTQTGVDTVNGLARLTPGGVLDPSFGNGGTVVNSIPADTDELSGVALQPADGNIVTVGTANNLTNLIVSRYLAH